jgi:hypothetical protein
LKAIDKTKGLSCPGELYCLSKTPDNPDADPEVMKKLESVKINGAYGRIQGRTFENYCHNKPHNKENRLLQGCLLYPTKPDLITSTLQVAIDVAEYFRELKELNLLPKLEDMSCYEFSCFRAAERATRKVQADKMQEMEDEREGKTKQKIGQGQTEESAFGW